ncbi:hypothetical protein RvY_04456 [Ramazzottius varieornatus]|uniref:Cytidine deaminase n=1 Tax=Ramazzottius varieornatus TaxID=947166 RepID=A0A1D1URN4_RAMVA|nr:hypothetical protein RvY_04456 [Ramazzottius varieornatus]
MSTALDLALLRVSEPEVRQLLQACQEVKKRAYSVYSNFRVGAALITERDRHIITGCNVENASYGLTVCAERAAICQAVSRGYREFSCIAVTSDVQGVYCTPCGACRQFIAEFSPEGYVLLVQPGLSEDEYLKGKGAQIVAVSSLLPSGFTPADLHLPKHKEQDVTETIQL